MPAYWHGPNPLTHAGSVSRPPVVVIADSGLGPHPWFDDDPDSAERDANWNGMSIGGVDADSDFSECVDEHGLILPVAGHGTFIAGIVRQICPDAKILSVPVLDADGMVPEELVYKSLVQILARHTDGQTLGQEGDVVDVLSLSIGYYHETSADEEHTTLLAHLLSEYGQAGVLVVAAAGNDSTSEPLIPAGLTKNALPFAADRLPMASVGALNPNGSSTALFSNQANWVSCTRIGACVISTLPVTFNGSANPTVSATPAGPPPLLGEPPRATVDPDDYRGGFAMWSGTSFAAPVLAGQLAHELTRRDTSQTTSAACVERGWSALEAQLDWRRP